MERIPLEKVGLAMFGANVDLSRYDAHQEMRDGDYHLAVTRDDRTLYSVIPSKTLRSLDRPNGLIREFRVRLEDMINDFERFAAAQKYAQPRGGFKLRPGRRRVRLS